MKYIRKLHDNLRRQQESDRFDTHTNFIFTILLDEIDRLASIVNWLKEDGEKLADISISDYETHKEYCPYCGAMDWTSGNIDHRSGCPIALHRQLMAEIEEKNK